jgi:hypothetical protein
MAEIRHRPQRTVHGQVTQRRTRCALHLDVGVLQQEQDGLQGVAVDLSDISLGYLGEGQARGPLQIDIV